MNVNLINAYLQLTAIQQLQDLSPSLQPNSSFSNVLTEIALMSQNGQTTNENSILNDTSSSSDVLNHLLLNNFPKESINQNLFPVKIQDQPDSTTYLPLIEAASNKYHIDKHLIQAVIEQESGYNPQSVSRTGAIGLMQLMPDTAKSLGIQDPFNPAENINGGTHYLQSLINRYHGNKVLALAAYNAGPGAVEKYHGVPPYKETQQYVQKVLANYMSKSNDPSSKKI